MATVAQDISWLFGKKIPQTVGSVLDSMRKTAKQFPFYAGRVRQDIGKKLLPEFSIPAVSQKLEGMEEIMRRRGDVGELPPYQELTFADPVRESLLSNAGYTPMAQYYFRSVPLGYQPREDISGFASSGAYPNRGYESEFEGRLEEDARAKARREFELGREKNRKEIAAVLEASGNPSDYASALKFGWTPPEKKTIGETFKDYASKTYQGAFGEGSTARSLAKDVLNPSFAFIRGERGSKELLEVGAHELAHTSVYPFALTKGQREQFNKDMVDSYYNNPTVRNIIDTTINKSEERFGKNRFVTSLDYAPEEIFAIVAQYLGPSAAKLHDIGKYYEPMFEEGNISEYPMYEYSPYYRPELKRGKGGFEQSLERR